MLSPDPPSISQQGLFSFPAQVLLCPAGLVIAFITSCLTFGEKRFQRVWLALCFPVMWAAIIIKLKGFDAGLLVSKIESLPTGLFSISTASYMLLSAASFIAGFVALEYHVWVFPTWFVVITSLLWTLSVGGCFLSEVEYQESEEAARRAREVTLCIKV